MKPTLENSVRIFVSLSARENANFQVDNLLKGRYSYFILSSQLILGAKFPNYNLIILPQNGSSNDEPISVSFALRFVKRSSFNESAVSKCRI